MPPRNLGHLSRKLLTHSAVRAPQVLIYGYRPVQRWRVRHVPGAAPASNCPNAACTRADLHARS